MPTGATIGKWTLQVEDLPANPATFVTLAEVASVSEVGETNETAEVTNFDSPAGTKEFIGGLSEGDEVSIECNYLSGNTTHLIVKNQVTNKTNGNAQLIYDQGGADVETFAFAYAPVSWKLNPSSSEANKRNFTLKISGGITVT